MTDNYLEDLHTRQKAAAFVRERMAALKVDRQYREEQWLEYYRMWRCKLKEEERLSGAPNLFVPKCHQHIEIIAPKVVMAIWATDPLFDLEGIEEGDEEPAQKNRLLTTNQLDRAGVFLKAMDVVRQLTTYGTAVIYEPWRTEVRRHRRRVWVQDDYVYTDKDMVVYNDPDFIPLDLFDCFFDDVSEPIDFIHRSWTTKERLARMVDIEGEPLYHNLDEIEGKRSAEDERVHWERRSIIGLTKRLSEPENIELWNWWGTWEDRPLHIVVANDHTEIRFEDNPYWDGAIPIVKGYWTAVLGSGYGLGIIEPNESMQNELNTLRNQRQEGVNLIINPTIYAEEDAVDDFTKLINAPGYVNWLASGGLAKIRQERPPDITGTAYQEESIIKQDMDNTAGISTLMSGMPTGTQADRAAKSIQLLLAAGNEGLAAHIELIRQQILGATIQRFMQLNQQFKTTEERVRVLGKEGYKTIIISPDDINKDFKVKFANAIDLSNRQFKQEQLKEFYKLTIADPIVNRAVVIQAMWEGLGFKNKDDIVQKQVQENSVQMPPELENDLMLRGVVLLAEPQEDHQQHLAVHSQVEGNGDPYVDSAIDRHIQSHKEYTSGGKLYGRTPTEPQRLPMTMGRVQEEGGPTMLADMGMNQDAGGY